MGTPVASTAGPIGSAASDDVDRLDRRDLLVLRLELLRRRRALSGVLLGGGVTPSGQRATRSTR
jgi:hypothetical protein